MIYEKIFLHENEEDVYFEFFGCDASREYSVKKRPSMLVCPGGGYQFCSDREAEPIARAFLARGYNCAVLRYSCEKKASLCMPGASRPLLEASETVSIMRQNSDKWNIDNDKIAVIGFSAGGHLAASLATMWDDDSIYENLDIEKGSNKPNAAILSYAVMNNYNVKDLGEYKEDFYSFKFLLGEYINDKALQEKYNILNRVSEKTPPCFLWHNLTDKAVPVETSLEFCKKMHEAGRPCELHVFPYGVHGMSTCLKEVSDKPDTYVGRWVDWCCEWLEKVFEKVI